MKEIEREKDEVRMKRNVDREEQERDKVGKKELDRE